MKHTQLTDDLQEKASLYAAGALPAGERLEYERHIEDDGCAMCRAEVVELQAAMALAACSVPAATPSTAVKARLLQQARSAAPEQRKSSVFIGRWWFELVTGAAAVAATVVMLSVIYANNELKRLTETLVSRIAQLEVQLAQQQNYFATLTSPEVRVVNLAGQGTNVDASGRIFWDRNQKRWLFYVHGLPRVANNLSYQLWFVPKSGNPVSATVFNTEANGSAEIEIDVPEGLSDLKAAAVTTEPAGGLPQPSGPFALLGALE